VYVESVHNSLKIKKKISPHREKTRKIFSQRKNVRNGEEISRIGRRQEKMEKWRKFFSHSEKARKLPAQPTAIAKAK